MMNKLKITGIALGMCLGVCTLNAQDTKPNAGLEKAPSTMAEAQQKAKSTRSEIGEACGIKDEEVLSQMNQILDNYELTLVKLKTEGKTEAQVQQMKDEMASARDKRLSGVMSSSEIKLYTKYKEDKLLEESALESAPVLNAKSPKNDTPQRPVKK